MALEHVDTPEISRGVGRIQALWRLLLCELYDLPTGCRSGRGDLGGMTDGELRALGVSRREMSLSAKMPGSADVATNLTIRALRR